MILRAGLAVILCLLPRIALASGVTCQAALDEYLSSSERLEWYRTNLSSGDQAAQPFLDPIEQAERGVRERYRVQKALSLLLDACFVSGFLSNKDCAGRWNRVTEFNNLIGASLSRTDTLNRNPIPLDGDGMKQMLMDQDQARAQANVRAFRGLRTVTLTEFRKECLADSNAWPQVAESYFAQVPVSASLELVRESFAAGVTPHRGSLAAGNYRCRVIPTEGSSPGRISESQQEAQLEQPAFGITSSDQGFNLTGEGYDGLFPYQFTLEGKELVARQPRKTLSTSYFYLRVTRKDRFVVEVVSVPQGSAVVRSIANPPLESGVSAYWSCKKQ
jgi:hypothetical protein